MSGNPGVRRTAYGGKNGGLREGQMTHEWRLKPKRMQKRASKELTATLTENPRLDAPGICGNCPIDTAYGGLHAVRIWWPGIHWRDKLFGVPRFESCILVDVKLVACVDEGPNKRSETSSLLPAVQSPLPSSQNETRPQL